MQGTLSDFTFDSPSVDALASDPHFWRLYDASFPSNEREPRGVILESLRKGMAFAIRARTDERTVGLATAHLLRKPSVLFIVYLAVALELRSRQIGAALFEKVWARGKELYSQWGLRPEGMVWEVEIPERASGEQELQQCRRRIAFFTRLGAHVLPKLYVQPPVNGIVAVPMHLMFWPAPGGTLPDDSELSGLVRAIYFEKYHEANGIPCLKLEDLLRGGSVR
jgi:hypothetical protein